MIRFQWSYGDVWVDCKDANNKKLTHRRKFPSMEPLQLTNRLGKMVGTMENDTMTFRAHGGGIEREVHIRRGPEPSELPMYAIVMDDQIHILEYEVSVVLFENGEPRVEPAYATCGLEKYKAQNKNTYRMVDGEYKPCQWKLTDLTRGQFDDMTKTRYTWEVNGPMRRDGMRVAVETLLPRLAAHDRAFLDECFRYFAPSEQDTEYGPYQFPDYLASMDRPDLAFQIVEIFQTLAENAWTPFDALTNARIEKARRDKRPMAIFAAQGQTYMIIFDAGNGESGQSSVVIQPCRYQKIMESIEEQFHQTMAEEHDDRMGQLFEELVSAGVNPRIFLMTMALSRDHALHIISDTTARNRISGVLDNLQTSPGGNLTTRMQQFMPALLQKFKECDIRMSSREELHPRRLCRKVAHTIETGLAAPDGQTEFKDLVHFIQRKQSWILKKGKNTCDICADTKQTTLSHCGSASACLKCWADSLVQTNMCCPFCRGTVASGQLKSHLRAPDDQKVSSASRSRKRKRNAFDTPEEILYEIQKDKKYSGITMASKEPMRKWFTILLRRKMVSIAQMPRNEQGKRAFVDAMVAFKLLEN